MLFVCSASAMSTMKNIYFLTFLITFIKLACSIPYPQSRHEIWLDEDYYFAWEIRGNIIGFDCIAKTQGWVGIGISNDGNMDGADFAISGFNDAGNIYAYDLHGVGHDLVIDNQENWWFLTFDNSTDTYVTFIRDLDTRDPQDVPIHDKPLYILWAFSNSDEVNGFYEKRGSFKVNLINP